MSYIGIGLRSSSVKVKLEEGRTCELLVAFHEPEDEMSFIALESKWSEPILEPVYKLRAWFRKFGYEACEVYKMGVYFS